MPYNGGTRRTDQLLVGLVFASYGCRIVRPRAPPLDDTQETKQNKKRLALAKTPAGRREAFAAPFVASGTPRNKRWAKRKRARAGVRGRTIQAAAGRFRRRARAVLGVVVCFV